MREIKAGPRHAISCVCRGSGRAILSDKGSAFLVLCPGTGAANLMAPTRANARTVELTGLKTVGSGVDFTVLLRSHEQHCIVCGRLFRWALNREEAHPGLCSSTCAARVEAYKVRHERSKGIENDYSRALGALYDKTPKAVIAAIAVSLLSRGGVEMVHVPEQFVSEWAALHQIGIVKQAPTFRLRSEEV